MEYLFSFIVAQDFNQTDESLISVTIKEHSF